MKKYLLLTCCSLLSASGVAQISGEQLLAGAGADYSLQQFQPETDYLRGHSFSSPYVKKLEFRTQTNDFDPRLQQYALRLTPNNLWLMRAQASLYQNMIQLSDIEQSVLLQNALAERYQLISDWRFLQLHLAMFRQQTLLETDKRNTAEIQFKQGLENDIDDLLKSEEALHKLQRDEQGFKAKRSVLAFKLQSLSGSNDTLDLRSNRWVDLPDIKTVVQSSLTDSSLLTPALKRRQAEIAMDLQKEKINRIESRRYFDFLQVRYNSDPTNLVKERVSISAGFILPVPGANRMKSQNLRLETLQSQRSYQISRDDLQRDISQKALRILQLIDEHTFATTQLADFQKRFDVKRLYADGVTNPMSLLRIKESELRQSENLLNLEESIVNNYLDFLKISGLMVAQPGRNFLVKK